MYYPDSIPFVHNFVESASIQNMGSVSSKGHRHSYGGLTSYNLERLAPGNTSKKARVVVPVNDECPTIRSSMELKRALSESSIMKQFQYYCSLRGQEELLSFYCASQNVRNSYKNHNMEGLCLS